MTQPNFSRTKIPAPVRLRPTWRCRWAKACFCCVSSGPRPSLWRARNLGIITVAEGVETAGQWNWLRAHGGELAQGYLFARPAATPPVSSAWSGAVSLN